MRGLDKRRRAMIIAPPQSVMQSRRRQITVRGQVQGVGFRPFVFRLANELALRGWVCNAGAGVEIELQGPLEALQIFSARLRAEAPPLARIADIEQCTAPLAETPPPFFIAASRADIARTAPAPDSAVCGACLEELFDPGDRRYRYPFINCVHCGPRYTITRALPYDRGNTSMAEFAQCPACRSEYENPEDRRFHAQADCCAQCGPRLRFHDGDGVELTVSDVIAAAATALREGWIVALQGLGGFHLLCDARNAQTVERLRARKGREAKPFAVMAVNVESLLPWVRCNEEERMLLTSPARPILLLEKTEDCDPALLGVAPGIGHLGAMLPYTPLHYLLFHEAAGRPAGAAWLSRTQPLVMICTSANRSGEPLVIGEQDAFARLRGIADVFVAHDRAIQQRCDDSVMRTAGGTPLFIRRARGFVPQAIKLPRSVPTVLAVGGDLKNTLCVTRDDEAFVSQHNGDLDNAAARHALEETLAGFLRMLDVAPISVVHDRHPDFFSSRLAQRIAAERDVPCVAVQHHHAHIAAVAAEQGLEGPVLGIALDGLGWGEDGGLWGGELLRVDGAQCRRLGHLQELALPGGDRAAREPWRMAASALYALGHGEEISRRFTFPAAATVREMLDKKLNAPLTSSAGRWFDAAAGLLGVAQRSSYEGQAAMLLESLAMRRGPVAPDQGAYAVEQDGVLNLLPLLARLTREQDSGYGAALFHATLVAALSEWVRRTAMHESLRDVILSGGCFMNGILNEGLRAALGAAGLKVHTARRLPSNDGGLSLGQAWVGICAAMAAAEPQGPELFTPLPAGEGSRVRDENGQALSSHY